MSKLLNNYNTFKQQNPDILYLFKNGAFYLALEDDARFLSNKFNLKLVNLNKTAVKCGFPCSSFDKYYMLLTNMNKKFKIVDSNIVTDAKTYLENREIDNLLKSIADIDIDNLSVSEAFAFIEKINKISKVILEVGGLDCGNK